MVKVAIHYRKVEYGLIVVDSETVEQGLNQAKMTYVDINADLINFHPTNESLHTELYWECSYEL